MADPPPSTAGEAPPMSPQPTQTNGNTAESSGPVAKSSPFAKLLTQAAAAATSFLSPPARAINTSEPSSEPSAITTITHATPAAAAAKRSAQPDSDDESSTAPKKPRYADFTTKKSDDDSLMSAEDEMLWEQENAKMEQMAKETLDAEERAAENMPLDPVANNVVAENFQEGQINIGDDEAPPPTERTFTWKRYDIDDRKITDAVLKPLLRRLDLPVSGAKKRVRFERLRDCGKDDVRKINDKVFEMKHYDDVEATLPQWVILNGEPVPNVEGINMDLGATEGFYNPTNPDKVPIADNRRNFLTGPGQRIKRPEFAAKPTKKTDSKPPPPPPLNGGPTKKAREIVGSLNCARPFDFFKTQITDDFVQHNMVDTTNARAVCQGEGVNTKFVPFDKPEMFKFIGFFMANGVCPRPQLEQWFSDNWILGNSAMKNVMEKKCRDGTTISAVDRLRQLRRLMCMYDPRVDIREETKKDPLFKVRPLLDELNTQARKMWRTGKWVSIDEQTLGFKGKSGLKLRISYKREGDGFQCDALCDRGYTFSFFFRHGDAPNVGHPDLDLSPTARRVIWLAKRLPNVWTCIFMDNLFNSRKLFTALYLEHCLAHGVVRTNGRGIPEAIIIPRETNPSKHNAMRGTTKAALLKNSKDCPGLISAALVDVGPVHILSTVIECIEWLAIEREGVWNLIDRETQTMKFLRPNFIDLYNKWMNSVDLSDQLRNNYRPDAWMRQRKWWWAFFIWGIGVATTNAWKIYETMYDEEMEKIKKNKSKNTLPRKWTHLEFILELIEDLMFPDEYEKKKEQLCAAAKKGDVSVESNKSTRSGKSFSSFSSVDVSSAESVNEYLEENKADFITEKRLQSNYFSARFDGVRHASVPIFNLGPRCQYCRYKWKKMDEDEQERCREMEQNRTHMLRRCLTCNVNLCWKCDFEWHGEGAGNS
eukprot:scaffold298_cov130-Skeletonema_menzelii.AAC.5